MRRERIRAKEEKGRSISAPALSGSIELSGYRTRVATKFTTIRAVDDTPSEFVTVSSNM